MVICLFNNNVWLRKRLFNSQYRLAVIFNFLVFFCIQFAIISKKEIDSLASLKICFFFFHSSQGKHLFKLLIQRERKERIKYLAAVTARLGRNILLEHFLSSGSKYQTRFWSSPWHEFLSLAKVGNELNKIEGVCENFMFPFPLPRSFF